MIPIFRVPAKVLEVSTGEFTCPNCKQPRAYAHKTRVERKIILFVPILGDTLEEYIECQTCRKRFSLDLLRTKVSECNAQIVEGLREKLSLGMSIEEAEALLQNAGMKISIVKQYISVAAGIGRKRCLECDRTYRKNVVNCRKCSHVLPAAPSIVSGA